MLVHVLGVIEKGIKKNVLVCTPPMFSEMCIVFISLLEEKRNEKVMEKGKKNDQRR